MAELTNLLFREMTEIDLNDVNHIEQQAHYHPWTKSLLNEAIHHYQCWILLHNQQIIGYGILKIVLNEAELLNIAITPQQQNCGYGKYLLTQLMQVAKKLGADECFLEVRESNHTAYKLYENFGFNEMGRRPNYYPTKQGYEDALIMGCLLID